ncbi:cytochrome c oxidase subunit 6C-like [Belonocnema kinseyi]|uniref:cytochrome c oxidase subunit 6C-like n=1 Tax=Belonocnema kinseyi TaxID=2817044 RepID=UPI00143DE49A|nr:cytochrome c oxidase subunit 6C-like [Belonocnema kinseyi]
MSEIIPKPPMRRMHINQVKKQLVGMVVFVGIGTMIFRQLYVERRKKRYDEFYKTYDCDAALQRMNDAGLMQSCPK